MMTPVRMCKNCGKGITKPKWWSDERYNKSQFCSRPCYYKFKRSQGLSKYLLHNCINCNKTIQIPKTYDCPAVQYNSTKFCGRDCCNMFKRRILVLGV